MSHVLRSRHTFIVMYQKSNFEVCKPNFGTYRYDRTIMLDTVTYIESCNRVFNSRDERMSLQNEVF